MKLRLREGENCIGAGGVEWCPDGVPPVPTTGRVALASQFGKPDIGERFMGHLIVTRASIHGFLVFDWWHRRSEALERLSSWQRTGQIRFKEDVLEGIERMPEAFLRLMQSKNFGKQIIKIS
jgi:NADPH-dependent curcumin reductase CurA